jgi:tRNA C32,U32 (ribose-2'-O)-methylase TrmJ
VSMAPRGELSGDRFRFFQEIGPVNDNPYYVDIPMRPEADSLNVAVAAGILLYHFSRAMLD